METRALSVNLREVKKNGAAKLRQQGMVPAVVYHKGEETVAISVDEIALDKLVHSAESHLIDLQYPDGKSVRAFIKDLQFDPVTDRVIHADFKRFTADEVVEMEVPIHVEGEAVGVKIGGGKLQINMHTLTLKGKPANMPEHFTIDVSALETGHSLHISDLQATVPAGTIEIIGDADAAIVSVAAPRKEAEAEAEEETTEEA
ncbi:ribosomal 5S rRNA E-loop binding protein Ctc/L25/TL5 [Chlorobaculum parvum NCIB 8327]|uniref:Large ribosomal subunit protein bL25 n=1 Tax=Chlorobaculum parvum (strain DSM 263 / NCIMB 8327) TaxID=517417 RepID=RL25_CHLP8|nr:50S ribosomal protein L25/general stress protein Ctc [Chlorobaculum parvum]B3QMQ8.1 RecName: Full=Large ribosomal subunit protein bL25; AltName: Full=50S ribosomal protein L25; AltName: Full=General stress protein CTC [Chlorobaculum parvum NCIB 8327]ACF11211.1 ribosomal 5S rRNA E-loop binding protein Ctc/L25/TL5 [Chlorobaculum parvum NCIB 8327]